MDRFADAINTIKTNEHIGRQECVVDSTKLIKAVLDVMKKEDYIRGYEEFSEGHTRKLRVLLSNKINSIGVIKPRYSIGKKDMQRFESRYIPSRDFGVLILSTPLGMMTNRNARSQGVGGRLVAYVY
jgi:small subunit ribosomal protein S8